jgi:putative ABC transport system permease protein
MALSVVLLIGAMLLVRSFVQLRHVDLGFRRENALTVRTSLPLSTYPNDTAVTQFYHTMLQRMRELPGVRSVGATRLLPLTGTIGDWSITIEGRPRVEGENPNGDWQVVTPGYLETMGVKLIRGRFFTDADNENAPTVAVINETMAKFYFRQVNPIGKHITTRIGNKMLQLEIVGVSRNAQDHDFWAEPVRRFYVSYFQPIDGITAANFAIRTAGDPAAFAAVLRREVQAVDRNLIVLRIREARTLMDQSLVQERLIAKLSSFFGLLALLLAAIGLYGVIAYSVSRRTREIGIRMALGAQPVSVLGLIMRQGLTVAAAGLVIGCLLAAIAARQIAGALYGIGASDPVSWVGAAAVLLGVSALANLIPARRAAGVDPSTALRVE